MGGGDADMCPTHTPELYVMPVNEGDEMHIVGFNMEEVKCFNVTM